MKRHIRCNLIGFSISLILSAFGVNADTTAKTATAVVEYKQYDRPTDPEGQMYHRFLATQQLPERLYYSTRMKAVANIDDTPEKESIVLITADTGVDGPRGEWVQAFLLIAENEGDVPKKKELFKLFDSGTYDLDVPGRTIELRNLPFVFHDLWRGEPWGYYGVSFELVDLTGDGILDIWVDYAYGVAVISFQNGEFKEVCSAYSSPRRDEPMEYVDTDNDGIYEIKIPDCIHINGAPGAAYLQWMSLYKWNGNTYINNEQFYAENDEFIIQLLEDYNLGHYYAIQEEYSFYIGLVFYYRDNRPMAHKYLQWVVKNAKKQDYIQARGIHLKKIDTPLKSRANAADF